jgi:hypothetical protein
MSFPTLTFWDQWGEAVIVAIVAGLLVLVIRQLSAFHRAKLAARGAGSGEGGYRQLAEEISAAFKESETRRQADAAALADVKQRLGAIETLLRQVE